MKTKYRLRQSSTAPEEMPSVSTAPTGRPMTEVDITEEDADFQEALRLQAASKSTPVASFWHWLG